jgi:tetratricopeptide (TPR) repeat protein
MLDKLETPPSANVRTTDEYIDELKMKLGANPLCASHHYNLGMAYLAKRMFQEAEASFREATENSPRFAEAYVQLGGICLQRGDIEGCLSYNRLARDCRIQFPVPYANMGFCYLQLGDAEKGIEMLKKAINRDPNYVQALATLGSAHMMIGEPDACIEYSRRAVEIEPEFGPAWNNLCVAHLEKGEHAKAVECADKAVASHYPVAQEILDELAQYREPAA